VPGLEFNNLLSSLVGLNVMARKRVLNSLESYKRSLKNGYGLGGGADYKPWVRVQDVNSHGASAKVWGVKTRREHHLLSEIETSFFYQAEFCDSVVDIREQFPLLPLNLSESIASHLGVVHPKVPRTKVPNVMTTDFLLTRMVGGEKVYEAISVKPFDMLRNNRTCEKLDLEKCWWDALGVDFYIFCGSEEDSIRAKNIEWATHPIRYGFDCEGIDLIDVLSSLSPGVFSISHLCDLVGNALSLPPESLLYIVRYLVGAKLIEINLDCPLQETGLIEILSVNGVPERGEINGVA
tara:strand:- start:1640 stop:2521 length:882 start_codon:yes stop_codon:yes gene_type:complete